MLPGTAKSSRFTMRRDPIRLSVRHQVWLHATFAVLFLSGAVWLGFYFFGHSESEFGVQTRPLESWCLRLHGAAAMLFLVVLGSLLRGHVRGGWKLRRNQLTGAVLLAFNATLTLTGYGLYYFGGEELRPWISRVHWWTGLSTSVIIFWHIWQGKSSAVKLNRPRS